jgi:hypothetical protein
MPYIGRGIQTGEYKLITLTESFDGSRTAFTMSESVPSEKVLMVILSGVLQHWGDSFTCSGTTLTFSAPPSSGETIKILKLGDTLNIATPSQNTVGVAQLSTTGISAGKVFKVNDAGNAWELGNASSAEIYGFTMTDTNSDGVLDSLQVTTTNGGQDNITSAVYEAFDDKIFAASGFTFSLNSSGHLIATI